MGNSRVLQVREGWQEPCIVWAMIIGESGTHKTPAMKRALASIQTQQTLEMEHYEQALEMHDIELEDYDAKFKAWKRSKHSKCPSADNETPALPRYHGGSFGNYFGKQ